MPIYEYRHQEARGPECPEVIEVFQSMADQPLETCPHCGEPVQRIFSAAAGHVNRLSRSNLRNQGFTRWVKRDKGVYEKDT
jgi:putative FmdB family regulatory protein